MANIKKKDKALLYSSLHTYTDESELKAKHMYGLVPMFREYLGNLHTPYYSTNSTDTINGYYPARYDSGGGFLQYYDGINWVNISTGGISGSGTNIYIPRFTPNGTTLGNSIMTQDAATPRIRIDDTISGVPTTNSHVLLIRTGFAGDGSATQSPLVFCNSNSTSVVNLNVVEMSATAAAVGSTIKYTLGRSMSAKNMYFSAFNYVGANSNSNYVEEIFYSGTTCRRVYASGNTVFGALADSGFKVEVGGTMRVTSQLTMGAPTTSTASFNLPTGSAPSAPVDGDVWREDNTDTGLKIRVNGITKTITLS